MKSKKERNKNPTVLAINMDYKKITKYPVNEDGDIINPNFNARTWSKKAQKAYNKGQMYFRYKNTLYPVPRIQKNLLDINEEE